MPLVAKSTIRFKSIEPSSLAQYLHNHPQVVLLDVRTPEEFAGRVKPDFGTLANAINVPIQQLDSSLTQLAPYQHREILVYCSHSHRSPQASYELTQKGFTNVTNLAGGMSVVQDTTLLARR